MLARLSRTEAAYLVIALASADDKKALVSASLARKGTLAVSEKYQTQIAALWEGANKEAVGFLTTILKNNPHKSAEQILKRSDVQSALRYPYEQAAKKSEAILHAAWAEAVLDTEKRVKGEFKLAGVDWKGAEPDESVVALLVDDLHTNAKAMRDRYSKALEDHGAAQDRLLSIAAGGVLRARYSANQAVWGASTAVRDAAFAQAGLNKLWVSRLADNTCSFCRKLHGTVVGPGDKFPSDSALKVYGDGLYGPPRHPNCQCVVVGTKLKKNSKNG